ncbi:MAG: hypothetical protein E7514_00130 [Ruminococcaceae bacterium]|nr:hypothetical protein [Oscillospiraceae bacterium]
MKSKKFLTAIITVLIISLTAAAAGLFALNTVDTVNVYLTPDRTELAVGETVTVSVSFSTSFYLSTACVPVYYNSSMFEFVEAEPVISDSAVITPDSSDYAKLFNNVGYSQSEYGAAAILYVARGGNEIEIHDNTPAMRLTLRAKDGASGTSDIFCTVKSKKTAAKPYGMLYFGLNTSGTSTADSVPESVSKILLNEATVSVTVDASAPRITALQTAEIDTRDGVVSGIPAGTSVSGLSDYIAVINGSFESSGNRTKDKVTVKRSNGTVYRVYDLVVRGDADGNGTCDGADYIKIKDHLANGTALDGDGTDLFRRAADYDGDRAVDMFDLYDIDKAVNSN